MGLIQTGPLAFLGLRPETSDVLVVRGVYRCIRHPLYTGGLMILWFSPGMTTGLLAFDLAATLYILIGSVFEERRLQRQFGASYAAYRQQVPRLIPNPLRGCRKPAIPPSCPTAL